MAKPESATTSKVEDQTTVVDKSTTLLDEEICKY